MVLDAASGFRSAQDLHTELRARGENIGLTTVYKQLRALTDAGEVDALRAADGETRYRRCATSRHHHHLVCRHCGHTVEIEVPEVERWADRVAADHQFTDVNHIVETTGVCADCARHATQR